MKALTPEFQKELFKYLIQNKTSVGIVKDISKEVFTFEEHKLFIILLKKYIEKYRRMPSSIDLIQFLHDNTKLLGLEQDVIPDLEDEIRDLFTPIKADEQFLSEHLITLVQYQQMKTIFGKYAPILQDGVEVWEKLKIELESTLSLGTDEELERPLPTSVLGDWYNDSRTNVHAYPTFMKGLNRLTAKGGFASPELIQILGLPKQFKTGTMLNIAIQYALSGLNVYVADFENGQLQMRERIKQALLEATLDEIIDNTYEDIIDACLFFWTMMGGSIWVGSYTANVHTARDVEFDMKQICKENNIENGFDCIIWDYADIMAPTVKQHELRHSIDRVYHDIISVHKRQGAFGFTASHTKQSSMGKFEPKMNDQSEAWNKNKNAHACFYITQDEEEAEYDLARIGVVFQRQGKKSGYFYVSIDFERQTLNEISQEDYEEAMEGLEE